MCNKPNLQLYRLGNTALEEVKTDITVRSHVDDDFSMTTVHHWLYIHIFPLNMEDWNYFESYCYNTKEKIWTRLASYSKTPLQLDHPHSVLFQNRVYVSGYTDSGEDGTQIASLAKYDLAGEFLSTQNRRIPHFQQFRPVIMDFDPELLVADSPLMRYPPEVITHEDEEEEEF